MPEKEAGFLALSSLTFSFEAGSLLNLELVWIDSSLSHSTTSTVSSMGIKGICNHTLLFSLGLGFSSGP